MLRDLLSSRWFQGGFAFFVLCVGGSLLYSWHVHRTTNAEFGKRPPAVSSIENKPETSTSTVDFQTEGFVNTPEENTDTPMPESTEADTIDETELIDMVDAFLPDDFVSEEEVPAEEVPVSPFGFGPYPDIPDDFPSGMIPIWTRSEEQIEQVKNNVGSDALLMDELLHRFLIQLWVQGDKGFTSGHIDRQTHRVFAMYPGTAYVTYSEMKLPNGKVIPRINSVISSDPIPDLTLENSGDIPGFTVISRKDVEIDPYTFLSLTK